KKIPLEEIVGKIERGERLGIDEAKAFLAASDKLLGGKALDTFYDAARREAKRYHSLRTLECTRIFVAAQPADAVQSEVAATSSKMIYLAFAPGHGDLNFITSVISKAAQTRTVAAFSPEHLFSLAAASKQKVLSLVQMLAHAGLSLVPGAFIAKATDVSASDETFSVLMQLHKFKLRTSAELPLSYSDAEKVTHLAKVREFEDRTHLFTHLCLRLDTKFSEKELLRTVAICRLMLDNLATISLSDYNLDQSGFISDDLLKRCAELGLNQN
ncbi:MAG: hypothetical protein IAF08_01350, partial [Rhizobacter sp.]|nr:hypothetical protein [Chlorobiales bacterium]